ncbi:MAG: T9SS type A sorting domain-containing protein [Bacteroidales bacterium]
MKTYVYKLVIGVVITLISLSTTAQDYQYIPLVKPGLQIWTTSATTEGYQHYNKFALTEEDTLIEGDTYKKLYWFQDSVFNPLTAECIGGLRENSQKQVFYKGKLDNNGEYWFNIMFYDFSLTVGDKINSISDGLQFKVSKIDTININGTMRKKFYIVGSVEGSPDTDVIGTWIEGIGNEKGLLYDMLRMLTGYKYSYLRCYEHNGELQYMANDITNCGNPFVGLDDISLDDNSITIYPNPTNSEVNISSENIINSIEIYNSLGQRVYYSVVNSMEKVIDISSFENGVYILGVNTENGVIRKKIIKN